MMDSSGCPGYVGLRNPDIPDSSYVSGLLYDLTARTAFAADISRSSETRNIASWFAAVSVKTSVTASKQSITDVAISRFLNPFAVFPGSDRHCPFKVNPEIAAITQ